LPYLAMISWCPNIQGSAQETVGIINVEALIRHLGAHSVGSLALSCRVWTGWSRTFSATLIFFARRRKSHWNCRPFSHSKPRKYTYTYTYAYNKKKLTCLELFMTKQNNKCWSLTCYWSCYCSNRRKFSYDSIHCRWAQCSYCWTVVFSEQIWSQ
jgi:hypothetical protein